MTEEPAEYMASEKRSKPKIDYSLYLVTDRTFCPPGKFLHQIEQAVLGGVSIVQLREKDASSLEFYNRAAEVSDLLKTMRSTSGLKIPFLINDRLDIALAVDCDGLHVGQEDLPAKVCRWLLGPKKILGVSVGTVEEAVAAEKDGADYLGVVAFQTGTKPEAASVSLDIFKEIRAAVSIPVVAIGGINLETVSLLSGLGIDGVAVVSAIMGSGDAKKAAGELKENQRYC
ncbi:MAG: thiamine phosphate synthase [Methanosarcinales archaeon]|jgi:thiamine-phosphate pyrophosphorylase|nr:thiamine phosphate synthase [Methanosarcinales archaeon]